MKLVDGVFFVGEGDSPDDREVQWTPGHVEKEIFAKFAGCEVSEVKHAFAHDAKEAGDDPAWWSDTKTEECPDPITFVFN